MAAQTASNQPRGTTNNLDGVACLSPSTCVAVGVWDTILRGTDGGRTWRLQPSDGTRYDLSGVQLPG